jgi:hypothetical protein
MWDSLRFTHSCNCTHTHSITFHVIRMYYTSVWCLELFCWRGSSNQSFSEEQSHREKKTHTVTHVNIYTERKKCPSSSSSRFKHDWISSCFKNFYKSWTYRTVLVRQEERKKREVDYLYHRQSHPSLLGAKSRGRTSNTYTLSCRRRIDIQGIQRSEETTASKKSKGRESNRIDSGKLSTKENMLLSSSSSEYKVIQSVILRLCLKSRFLKNWLHSNQG